MYFTLPPSCLPLLHRYYPASSLLLRLRLLSAGSSDSYGVLNSVLVPTGLPVSCYDPSVISPLSTGTGASLIPGSLATTPCRIEFTVIGMTITDWQFTFCCFPPHLLVTQLLHVSAQCTFGLDRTFTFLFHNHYGRTRKAACGRIRLWPNLSFMPLILAAFQSDVLLPP